jgi:hypothetical protein
MHAITIAAVQQCNYTQISKTSTVWYFVDRVSLCITIT